MPKRTAKVVGSGRWLDFLHMQFKTKIGLVDIPDAEVLTAAREISCFELKEQEAKFFCETAARDHRIRELEAALSELCRTCEICDDEGMAAYDKAKATLVSLNGADQPRAAEKL